MKEGYLLPLHLHLMLAIRTKISQFIRKTNGAVQQAINCSNFSHWGTIVPQSSHALTQSLINHLELFLIRSSGIYIFSQASFDICQLTFQVALIAVTCWEKPEQFQEIMGRSTL